MSRKKNTSLIIKAIMLLLSLIVMVVVASLAWFTSSDRPVPATGISVSTSDSKEFEMAVGFKSSVNGYQYTMSDYFKTLNLRDVITPEGVHYDALKDFSPLDVTGDGVTLVRPSMMSNNIDIDRNIHTFSTLTPNKEYISFDMYFRSNKECKVYLDSDSYVIAAVEEAVGDGSLVGADVDRKAAEGNYSKDAVVGAVRVAFVNYNTFFEGEDIENRLDTARLLWLPRPDIHLDTNNWILATDLTKDTTITDHFGVGTSAENYADTFTHHYYYYVYDSEFRTYQGEDRNYVNTITDPSRDAVCDVSTEIIETDENGISRTVYYGKTQVNIWVEGCDAEANRSISGGQFYVNFDLAGGS